ncbi:MAG: hypothetical protein R2795_18245 [Saprospiraceae bacterium]
MQKIFFSLFIVCLTVVTSQAQSDTQGKRWWYGAHVNLGFSSQFNFSTFSVGAEPMAGYKILPALSVDP